jgi:hypothetical protein
MGSCRSWGLILTRCSTKSRHHLHTLRTQSIHHRTRAPPYTTGVFTTVFEYNLLCYVHRHTPPYTTAHHSTARTIVHRRTSPHARTTVHHHNPYTCVHYRTPPSTTAHHRTPPQYPYTTIRHHTPAHTTTAHTP